MAQKILTGFLVKDVSSFADLEMLIFQMRQLVLKQANLSFERLVIAQIERIVDEITLNQEQRPECSILDIAVKETERRIIYAEKAMQKTEYNLHAGLQIMTCRYEDKDCVFFKINCVNEQYLKVLKKIPELDPIDLYDTDITKKSKKGDLWKTLIDKYDKDIPTGVNLLLYEDLSVNPEKFTYRSPMERAGQLAQEKILNHLVSCYATNREVQPHKLMEFTLQALARLQTKQAKEDIEFQQQELIKYLPAITFDMISKTNFIEKNTPPEESPSLLEADSEENV